MALNKQISATTNPLAVLDIVVANHQYFDAVNVSTCLHRAAKHAHANDILNIVQHPGFGILRDAVPRYAQDCRPQQLCNILWAFAKLEVKNLPPVLVEAVMQKSMACVRGFVPQNISNMLWACAKLEITPPEALLTGLLVDGAMRQLNAFTAQNMSNVMWACANLKHAPPPAFVQQLQTTAINTMHEFAPQAVKDMLWGFASLDIRCVFVCSLFPISFRQHASTCTLE